ncbi:MAG: hypothetical protein LBT86_09670 [Deltaproteobacteria bacterium]|nr:hypothetical protein [Deltaproteobacteria bacterium]
MPISSTSPTHRFHRPLWSLLICFFIFLIAGPDLALGQAPVPRGAPSVGSITQEVQKARPERSRTEREETGLDQSVSRLPSSEGGATIMVNDFILEEMGQIPEKDIRRVLEPFKGRELTMGQLQEAAARVGELFRQKGYPAVQVYLPQQNAQNGVITLRALVGSFGASSMENSSLVTDWYVKKMIQATLKEGQLVTRKDLERMVLLFNDLPGAGMPKLTMGPGVSFGQTQFLAQVPKGPRFNGYVMTDNMGSVYTGHWRFMSGIDVNSPFNLGDKLSVFGMTTSVQGINSAAINYSVPITPSGARLQLGYTYVYYELGDNFKDLGATGSSKIMEASVRYPLIRSAKRNLYLDLGGTYKLMDTTYSQFTVEEETKSLIGKVGLVNEYWGSLGSHNFYNKIGASVSYGNLTNEKTWGGLLQPREDEEGDFSYANLDLTFNVGLNDFLALSLTGTLQKALRKKTLDGAEQLNVTGGQGVRAYREGLSGDSGYIVSSEFRFKLPSIGQVDHAFGLFADHAGWKLENSVHPTSRTRSGDLSDVGVAYYLNFPHVSLRAQVVRAVGAFPTALMRSEPETYGSFTMIMFL